MALFVASLLSKTWMSLSGSCQFSYMFIHMEQCHIINEVQYNNAVSFYALHNQYTMKVYSMDIQVYVPHIHVYIYIYIYVCVRAKGQER